MAKLITFVENEDPKAVDILKTIYPHRKKTHRVGITGPPGSGKSTLVDHLIIAARKQGFSVGVICVDPTSPFTGGALLGDRIRMNKAAEDPEVYIRSMATRGSLGGMARTTEEVAEVLEASGKEIVFIETVGVGQSELDVFNAVDTVVVVLVPESGAGVQAMKAGLMEIAHVFVVNKADRAGANRVKQEIEDVLSLAPPQDWETKVLLTQAYRGIGTHEVFEEILVHRRFLDQKQSAKDSRSSKIERKLRELIREQFDRKALGQKQTAEAIEREALNVMNGKIDPYTASENLLHESIKHWHEK